MTTSASSKLSHANSDRRARERKAERIARILEGAAGDLATKDVLDIGTGAGYIASHLARRVRSLVSVDVVDERVARDFAFRLVGSEQLPFADASFDAVISNHVIEHVDDQLLHLSEIRRVLRPSGMCYLATPNRFAVIEPHFKLPLLSWPPASVSDRYVRLARRGERFDVTPLTYPRLVELGERAGLDVRDCSLAIAREALDARLHVAPPLAGWMRPLLPSFVVLLSPRKEAA